MSGLEQLGFGEIGEAPVDARCVWRSAMEFTVVGSLFQKGRAAKDIDLLAFPYGWTQFEYGQAVVGLTSFETLAREAGKPVDVWFTPTRPEDFHLVGWFDPAEGEWEMRWTFAGKLAPGEGRRATFEEIVEAAHREERVAP
jgi:hypothetical protein